jgi:hypothetical protein
MHGLCRHVSRRDGSVYEGAMVHGERKGQGKLTFAWADVYEGELARDLPNGSGIMYTSAGICFRTQRPSLFLCLTFFRRHHPRRVQGL